MNFQQLRIIQETVRRNFNLTEVAAALFTSQSGVSRHVRDLEEELGVDLFIRKGKRFLGLTEPGKDVAMVVDRILLEVGNLKTVAAQFSDTDSGNLTVAATHTQARYALPPAVAEFKRQFPRVHLTLTQASPAEISTMLLEGAADIGVATESLADTDDLIAIPYYTWHHAVIVPQDHPLTAHDSLSLTELAQWPIITYHDGFTGRPRIDQAFAEANLSWDLVMAAMDADVIKTYVQLGLGIGIIASMAFDAQRDQGLVLLDSASLFPASTSYLAVRKGRLLRGYARSFLQSCVPSRKSLLERLGQG
ncbi:CysB family HTH-type transcriptional regulator [Insolitispirillum peregrinum]|uniref:CysB family HTH-type transcriptional regulator n=1 Tax=Insolitispirillum peregrinum TaxID=80876 RepID=UPI003611BEA4